MSAIPVSDACADLVHALEENGSLDSAWSPAFLGVPRHLFLPPVFWAATPGGYEQVDRAAAPEEWMAAAYRDAAAVTQWDDGGGTEQITPTSSASMPSMVAAMLADLQAGGGNRVLEVGTGTGWNAGLLAHRLGPRNVTTIEFDGEVAGRAAVNLAAVGPSSPLTVVGDGAGGWSARAPYDRILSTCSVARIPAAWTAQTRPGGMIVAPYSPLFGGGAILRLTVEAPGRAEGFFTRSSAFMLLRQHRFQAPPVDAYLPGEWPGDATRTETPLDPETIGDDWPASFVVGLTLPDVYYRRAPYGPGWTWWIFDSAVTSWATVDSVPGAEAFDVRQSGPRRLWDEVEAAWRGWDRAGRPGFDRYGLTLSPAGHQAWLDTPDNLLTT